MLHFRKIVSIHSAIFQSYNSQNTNRGFNFNLLGYSQVLTSTTYIFFEDLGNMQYYKEIVIFHFIYKIHFCN